jgi:hypothetical protein
MQKQYLGVGVERAAGAAVVSIACGPGSLCDYSLSVSSAGTVPLSASS